MINPNTNQKSLFQELAASAYQEQVLRSDEKFSIWEGKSFAERQSIFKKVRALSLYSEDSLSNWVAEQMDILLARSVMG